MDSNEESETERCEEPLSGGALAESSIGCRFATFLRMEGAMSMLCSDEELFAFPVAGFAAGFESGCVELAFFLALDSNEESEMERCE